MSDRRLVLIEWVDSFGCSTGWRTIPEVVGDEPSLCLSVGWIIGEGKKTITIVPHMSHENDATECADQGCGDMTIPIQCIKRIVTLVEAQT